MFLQSMLGAQPQKDKTYFVENEAIHQKIIKNIRL